MDQPALEFNNEEYEAAWVKNMVRDFQAKGYAVLPGVFQRDSVDPYLEQLKQSVQFDGNEYSIPDDDPLHVWAAQAPRVRQILTPVLTHTSAAALPSLCNSMWIIQPYERPDLAINWHKDREPEGMPGDEYHYPIDAFVGFYFEDMTEEKGSLKVIPGSHWDAGITPYTDDPQDTILARKEDGVLLDQRAWHSGGPRTEPGMRMLVVYAYFLVPVHYGQVHRMPRSQRQIWHQQGRNRYDQAFWGGIFAPPTDRDTGGPPDGEN